MYSGLRIGELCALTWNDIDFKNGIIRVSKALQRVPDKSGKGKTALIVTSPKSKTSVRDIPVPAFVLDILKRNLLRKVNRQNSQKLNLLFVTGIGKKRDSKASGWRINFFNRSEIVKSEN